MYKKIQIWKKSNIFRKKSIKTVINKNSKSKVLLLFKCAKKYIFIVNLIILFFHIEIYVKKFLKKDTDYIKYKGSKIKKEKLIKDYLSRISDEGKIIGKERKKLHKFFYLPKYPKDPKAQKYYKKQFLKKFSKIKHKRMKKIDTAFIEQINYFGNRMIILNNIIFYCEVLGCHKIILDDKTKNLEWPIKNTTYIQKLNMTITLGSKVDCNNGAVICQTEMYWDLFYPSFIKPQVRLQYIKEEILRNIPKS